MEIKVVTASSLYDGHDVSINIFRKLLLKKGVGVIHLGHNRSVQEIISVVQQEDVDAILISSYQGGHNEYFKYLIDELKRIDAQDVMVFGGGGGVIIPSEIEALEEYGVEKIYHALEGQKLGIDGIADDIVKRVQSAGKKTVIEKLTPKIINDNNPTTFHEIAKQLSFIEVENETGKDTSHIAKLYRDKDKQKSFVLGITGPGGAGKSSMVDELVNRFLKLSSDLSIGIITVDPAKRFTGGALFGDRIRFNNVYNSRVFFRSFSSEANSSEISPILEEAVLVLKSCGFDLIIIETSGIGQGDSKIIDYSDESIYVMTSEFGASTQLDKIDMLEVADYIVINKFEKPGSEDAFREVALNYIRHKKLKVPASKSLFDAGLPIYAVSSNQFNNPGLNRLIQDILSSDKISKDRIDFKILNLLPTKFDSNFGLIDNARIHYLALISDTVFKYKKSVEEECEKAGQCYNLKKTIEIIDDKKIKVELNSRYEKLWDSLNTETKKFIESWPEIKGNYSKDNLEYKIQNKDYSIDLNTQTLSGTLIPKIALPKYENWKELLLFYYKENLPGCFPYTAGVFPFRRVTEAPKRQFAGEGSSERTNKRFHYLTQTEDANRLSVAFDGITLYGENPGRELDNYGKIGESGVSISTIEEMDKLLAGYDLTDPLTSVSMTINAPAPAMLAMYFMVGYRRELKKLGFENSDPEQKEKIKLETFRKLRGTVQADMLKEDQAQNTCIFSIDFAMKLIGDVQEYLSRNEIKNYYSLSISGYHIAEAGASPITQAAFTLANGFTYVEYFLKRGMKIDEFAPNLSFFFSNGMEPEYAVIGRVARRIWAIAIRDLYGGNSKSQKLKYHIQTSGRSLHAQEMSFNDIRTTLQALMAYYDNCNSLHTNSYDEAVTTPTEESVRRSMAIQMIIMDEMRMTKNENPNQGSFIIEELTDLVEEAILNEFYKISHRGGVIGAMEKQYQRSKIQEESLVYEEKKRSGEYPLIGINKFVNETEENPYELMQLTRCQDDEKEKILANLEKFEKENKTVAEAALLKLKEVALKGDNIFEELLKTVEVASLGKITNVLYETGGKYRRGI